MLKMIIGTLLIILPHLVVAKDAEKNFTSYAVSQAHKAGFMGCDEEIKSLFKASGGADIRVNADWFVETKGDAVRLTSIWGNMGDSIFQEVELRKSMGNCFVTVISVLTTTKDCSSYIRDMKAFKFVYRTLDFIGLENEGKVPMYVKPLNHGCVVIFQESKKLNS